ncbi:hypothetical protein [Sporocytophaga myxococcoides]|uniref:hypothetical protein n=1 Tax=Sporocytophaga myxococcoides TaxID=153721 RepID=UPI00041B1711|nr:hypothetical protein [Sporocytophaga myxococcoides]
MEISYNGYTIKIVDDSSYTLKSVDNKSSYDFEYFEGMAIKDRVHPSSKHGVRVYKDGKELTSAIISEIGGATTIHHNSAVVKGNSLVICCSDMIYSLSIPELRINWRKRLDLSTCFGVYHFMDDLVVHGELQITRIDKEGNEKWSFGARDIFVTQDGRVSIELRGDKIKLIDWNGDMYVLNEYGQEI